MEVKEAHQKLAYELSLYMLNERVNENALLAQYRNHFQSTDVMLPPELELEPNS